MNSAFHLLRAAGEDGHSDDLYGAVRSKGWGFQEFIIIGSVYLHLVRKSVNYILTKLW